MKPDWKDAPEWANYLAMDSDGEWCWFEEKPRSCANGWIDTGGEVMIASLDYWTDTLEKRPKH